MSYVEAALQRAISNERKDQRLKRAKLLASNKNIKLLEDFTKYCKINPQERFWQALRNWLGVAYLGIWKDNELHPPIEFSDTFYWAGKNK